MRPLCPEVARVDGDRAAVEVAADLERVAAEEPKIVVETSGFVLQDDEAVVALLAVDLEDLDRRHPDEQAGAVDAVAGDDEGVAELGADHDDGVDAGAAVDVDRGVVRVLDEVVAEAAEDARGAAGSGRSPASP